MQQTTRNMYSSSVVKCSLADCSPQVQRDMSSLPTFTAPLPRQLKAIERTTNHHSENAQVVHLQVTA
jgi:hypothetical protein